MTFADVNGIKLKRVGLVESNVDSIAWYEVD
jgi:hypothetical protein